MSLLGLLCMFSLLIGCAKPTEPQVFTNREPSKPKETVEENQETVSEYRLEEINMEEETMTFYAFSLGRQVRYSYHLGTKFLDKYGNRCSATKFTPGVIVQLGELTERSSLSSVQLSDAVWNYDNITRYKIDQERGILTIGDSKYRLQDTTAVFSYLDRMDLAGIGEDDTLCVIGKDKDVWSIMVTTGHGYMQFVNTGVFQDSMVCIGNRIFATLVGDMTMEVPEGTYDVTVANQGYGGTANFSVTRNETTIVDLEQLKGSGPKTCKITFETEVEGAKVFIDGTEVGVGQELDVTYGAHALKVTAEGYSTWKKTLVVNSPSATISLDLTDEKEEQTTSSNSQSSASNGSTEDGDSTSSTNKGSSTSSTSKGDSSGTSSSGQNSGSLGDSSKSDKTDAEVDYLTTISNMLSNLLD